MPDDWKPHGYPQLSPYLVTRGAPEVIAFLEAAFDAKVLRRYDRPDGTIMHVELRIGDSVVMLGEGTDKWPPIEGQVHLYVPDVDEAYRRGLAAGGVSITPPAEREDDPDRRGGLRDPSGNSWWIATQVRPG
ncbi:MAG: VOC family protein [Myxococcaceae bacterium]|nr:VOC family protein [Myxococcaceae bacterium]